jgi:tetratricopeptide (TPR) repeat protein
MKLHQWMVLAVAFVTIVGLSLMPRFVVKNDNKTLEVSAGDKTVSSTSSQKAHNERLSVQNRIKVDSLRNLIKNQHSSNKQGYSQTLELIIDTWKTSNHYDSAAFEVERFSQQFPDDELAQLQTGELFYEAFTFALDDAKASAMASKAREWLEKYVQKHPDNLDVQTKIGMTFTTSESPMQGIMKLRDVLQKDPNHRLALFNLGVLSIRSNQYDKALERFLKLTQLDGADWQNYLYLGICYKELGRKDEAVKALNLVKQNETNPQLIEATNALLSELGVK